MALSYSCCSPAQALLPPSLAATSFPESRDAGGSDRTEHPRPFCCVASLSSCVLFPYSFGSTTCSAIRGVLLSRSRRGEGRCRLERKEGAPLALLYPPQLFSRPPSSVVLICNSYLTSYSPPNCCPQFVSAPFVSLVRFIGDLVSKLVQPDRPHLKPAGQQDSAHTKWQLEQADGDVNKQSHWTASNFLKRHSNTEYSNIAPLPPRSTKLGACICIAAECICVCVCGYVSSAAAARQGTIPGPPVGLSAHPSVLSPPRRALSSAVSSSLVSRIENGSSCSRPFVGSFLSLSSVLSSVLRLFYVFLCCCSCLSPSSLSLPSLFPAR